MMIQDTDRLLATIAECVDDEEIVDVSALSLSRLELTQEAN